MNPPHALCSADKHVVDLLEAARGPIAEEIFAEIAHTVAEDIHYAAVPADELRQVIEAAVGLAFDALRERRGPTSEELALVRAIGVQRARQGVPVDQVLRALRAGALAALSRVQSTDAASGVEPTELLDLVQRFWRWVDEVAVALADAPRQDDLEQRSAFLRSVLLGDLDRQALHAGMSAHGLAPDRPVLAVRLRPPASDRRRILSLLPRTAMQGGLTGVLGSDIIGLLTEEPPAVAVPAGRGPMVPISSVARSFRAASRALETAAGFGLTGWHTLESLATRAAVLADDEVGAALAARTTDRLRTEGSFGDELLTTLRAWWAHGQNTDAAAAALAIHPNSLRHRLARLECITGGSLRDVEHVVALWWALARDDASAHTVTTGSATPTAASRQTR